MFRYCFILECLFLIVKGESEMDEQKMKQIIRERCELIVHQKRREVLSEVVAWGELHVETLGR